MPPRWLALLLALCVLVPGLGAIDLWAPDEPRYGQVAEEMRSLEHGASGLLLLHLGGEVYTQKPPLYFWLAALAGAGSGHVDEWAARAPSVLAALGSVLAVQIFGARLFTLPGVGPWSALVLLTLLRFAHQARRAQLDVLLTLFETIAIAAGWSILSARPASAIRPRTPLLVLHAAVGLALLTKGPVGALPYVVLLVVLTWEGRLAEARRLFPWWGVTLALAPLGAWLASCVALAPAGFFADAVIDNVGARFFSGTDHVRPFYYYARQLPLDLLPWTPLVVAAAVIAGRRLREARAGEDPEASALRLLLAWGLTFIVFFSLSSGKRGLYMLPALPAAALLCGWLLARASQAQRLPRGLEPTGIALVAIIGAIGGATLLVSPLAAPVPSLRPFGSMLAIIAAIYVPTALWLRHRGRSPGVRGSTLLIALAATQLALFIGLFPALDAEKSPRPLAIEVTKLTSPDERVGVYRHSALLGGIEYYGHRRAVALEGSDDLHQFVAEGNRIVVARVQTADEVARVMNGKSHAAVRHGNRRLVVLEAGAGDPAREMPSMPGANAVPPEATEADRPGPAAP